MVEAAFFDSSTRQLVVRLDNTTTPSDHYTLDLPNEITDFVGNRLDGGGIVPFELAVATSAPAALPALDLSAAEDTGASDTDNITQVNTPSFSGTVDEFTTAVDFLLDGVLAGSVDTPAGTFDFTFPIIPDGVHELTVVARNPVGSSDPSPALTITVDTVGPAAPSTPDLIASDDSGADDTDNITNVTSPTVQVDAVDGSLVRLFVDDVEAAQATSEGFLIDFSISPLNAGTYQVTATAEDAAGNVSSGSALLDLVIDTAAPAAPTTPDLLAADDSGPDDMDNITNIASPTVRVDADTGSLVRLFIDGVEVDQGTATSPVDFTLGPLADAEYAVTATVEDPSGNVSGLSDPLRIQIDTVAPMVSIEAPIASADHSKTARLIGLAIDGETDIGVAEFSIDGTAANNLLIGDLGRFDQVIDMGWLAAGPHQLDLTLLDLAGNMASRLLGFGVSGDFVIGSDGSTGWGVLMDDGAHLEERSSFVVQASFLVELGQDSGTRTLSFELDASFDTTDTVSLTSDRLEVYLVDPADPSQTLLDAGRPGTALFTLSESGAEFPPGRVRFDGSEVTIDLSSLSALATGQLAVQLINGDGDDGTIVGLGSLTNEVDAQGTASRSGICLTRPPVGRQDRKWT